jgi:hypothetical protein
MVGPKKKRGRPKKAKPPRAKKAGAPPASDTPLVHPGDLRSDTQPEPTRRGPGRPPKPPGELTQGWTGIKLFSADVTALGAITTALGIGNSEALRRAVHFYARAIAEGRHEAPEANLSADK